MPHKFTFEEHQERMRQILLQASPVERAGVIGSLMNRLRDRQPIVPRQERTRLPELPELPEIEESSL